MKTSVPFMALGQQHMCTPAFTYVVVYGLCSFAVSIAFPIYIVNYVKKNTITGDTKMAKGMIKFTTILLIENAMNFFGLSILYLLQHSLPAVKSITPWRKLSNTQKDFLSWYPSFPLQFSFSHSFNL